MSRLPSMLSYRVSREATLLYMFIVHHARHSGICENVIRMAADAALARDEMKGAIEALENEGLIETFKTQVPIVEFYGGGVLYGSRLDCRILDYKPPDQIGRLSAEAWKSLREQAFERDDYTCGYCGGRGKSLECDHVIPIAKGGTNELGNLITACRGCNRKKRDKMLEEWRNA